MDNINKAIDERRARADILAAKLSCFLAVFTVAEECGECFSRRSSEIFELHMSAPLKFVVIIISYKTPFGNKNMKIQHKFRLFLL